MANYKAMIETPGGFVQVQGLPEAVRVDVGDDKRALYQWLTVKEAELFAKELEKAIAAAKGGK